ncbi:MAG: caspase family protein [Ignavibacteriae bacterium]|nr:caspase family protein [Ignavibacteriota bacterium]
MILFSIVLKGQSIVYHAVIAGIDNYNGVANNLQYAVQDAYDMKQTLINHQGFLAANIEYKINTDANSDELSDDLAYMPRGTGKTNLFFFSGHGSTDGILTYHSDLPQYLAPYNINSFLGYQGFNQFTAIIDACNSGVFVDEMTNGVILSACTANQNAYELAYLENGCFTEFIIEGLRNNAAADINGILSAEGLLGYTFYRTIGASCGQQVPQLKDNYSGKLVLNSNVLAKTQQYNQEEYLVENNEPSEYYLHANYPNPFNPSSTINYIVKEIGNVNITIYDALGRKVKELVNEIKEPGSYNVKFDGSDLATGIYIYTMRVNNFFESKKMILNK